MFKELNEHLNTGDTVTVVITKMVSGLVVSVKPSTKLENVLPIQMTGTAEEMDDGFVEAISTPLKRVGSKLGINTEAFDESMKTAEPAKEKTTTGKASSRTTKAVTKAEPPKDPAVQQANVDALIEKKDYAGAIELCDRAIKQKLADSYWKEKKKEYQKLEKEAGKPATDKAPTDKPAPVKKETAKKEEEFVPADPTIEILAQVDLHMGRKDYASAISLLTAETTKHAKDKVVVGKLNDRLYDVRLEKQRAFMAEDEEVDESEEVQIPKAAAPVVAAVENEEDEIPVPAGEVEEKSSDDF